MIGFYKIYVATPYEGEDTNYYTAIMNADLYPHKIKDIAEDCCFENATKHYFDNHEKEGWNEFISQSRFYIEEISQEEYMKELAARPELLAELGSFK